MIFGKLLAVIAVWFVALQVWDLGTLKVLRAIRSVMGVVRLLAGGAIGLCALLLLYVWLPPSAASAFSWMAIGTFVAALAAEFLIGEDLRARMR